MAGAPPPVVTRAPLGRVSVAPMMARTDRHFRWLARTISARVVLYTEMIMGPDAPTRIRREFCAAQRPLVLQVGGRDPAELAELVGIAAGVGYDEVDLNCGCPSEHASEGGHGVALMHEPDHVARCVEAMRAAGPIPITVKHRLGGHAADDDDPWDTDPDAAFERLLGFVDRVHEAGCDRFIVHARQAWIGGGGRRGPSAKFNRSVPPLRHEVVSQLKRVRPHLHIERNGGIGSIEQARRGLEGLDGVMIGRYAYRDPFALADIDRRIYGDAAGPSRADVLGAWVDHVAAWVRDGGHLHDVTRHALGLFRGIGGGRACRGVLSGQAPVDGADLGVLRRALGYLEDDAKAALLARLEA